jgi:hypothetical protein
MPEKPSFLNIHKDENYKLALIDSLTGGITDQYLEYFEMTMIYVIDKKYHLFDKPEFQGSFYEGEDETLDFILPAVRRVFGKVFITPPKIFVVDPKIASVKGYKEDGRLELFRMHYDVDEFLDYIVTHLLSSKDLLSQFEYIDRGSMTLEIIVDNYIAGLVKKVLDSDDIKRDIRDLKLKKMIEND